MKIQFCGAARSVTGSQHLIEINGRSLLLDCGLFQGHREEAFLRNRELPFDAASIDAVILSHAHIDHSGNIPNLVRSGFRGRIFCTPPTADLCAVMLKDSAFIQERDVEYMNRRLARKRQKLREPLYTVADVQACVGLFEKRGYGESFEPFRGVRATFYNAGHMFGSAMILLEITEGTHIRRVVFTGDLGRRNLPIIEDPDQITAAEILISESTYGNKMHDPVRDIQEKLVHVIQGAADKNGKIIIPAFSVERTQELVYHLNKLYENRQVPSLPVFVDSPLAVNVTDVFTRHPDYWDAEAKYLMSKGDNPFRFDQLRYITKVEDSKKLNSLKEPCLIISASGMCEAGRILHHLANNIENPASTVLIVGFMAENTLGRRLVNKEEMVKIFGEEYALKADVVKLNSFSGHADQNDLIEFARKAGRQAQVFLVHGEDPQSGPLAEKLRQDGFKYVNVPGRLDVFDV